MNEYDVVIYDSCSGPIAPSIADVRGVGGVEWTYLTLAPALAATGRRVLVLSAFAGAEHAADVEYGHISRAFEQSIKSRAIILSRWSRPPPIAVQRAVVCLHDIPEAWMFDPVRRLVESGAADVVCVSTWLVGEIDRFVRARRAVPIPPMLLDECYEHGEKDPQKFMYGSAAHKGLAHTIEMWALIQDHFPELALAKLYVATNGYDTPSAADGRRMRALGIESLGALPARAMIRELRSATGLFQVNAYPETHGIVYSAALALGCRTHVLCRGDEGALPETLHGSTLLTTDRTRFVEDFVSAYMGKAVWHVPVLDNRARVLLPKWLEVLDG